LIEFFIAQTTLSLESRQYHLNHEHEARAVVQTPQDLSENFPLIVFNFSFIVFLSNLHSMEMIKNLWNLILDCFDIIFRLTNLPPHPRLIYAHFFFSLNSRLMFSSESPQPPLGLLRLSRFVRLDSNGKRRKSYANPHAINIRQKKEYQFHPSGAFRNH
jgi:hypothetical protein